MLEHRRLRHSPCNAKRELLRPQHELLWKSRYEVRRSGVEPAELASDAARASDCPVRVRRRDAPFAEGPATRRRYAFQHPGAVLEVDARDAPSLARIPLVRRRRRESG